MSYTPAPNAYPNEENEKFKMTRTATSWARKTATSGFGTAEQREKFNKSRRLDVRRNLMSSQGSPGPGEYMGHKK